MQWNSPPCSLPRRPPLLTNATIGDANGVLDVMHTRHKVLYTKAAHNLNRHAVLCLLGSTRAVDTTPAASSSSTPQFSENASYSAAVCISGQIHPYFYIIIPPDIQAFGLTPEKANEFAQSLDDCIKERLEYFVNKASDHDTPKTRRRRQRVNEELCVELALAEKNNRCAWIESCTYTEMLPIKDYTQTKQCLYRVAVRNPWVHKVLVNSLSEGHRAWCLVDADAARGSAERACAQMPKACVNEYIRAKVLHDERYRRFQETERIYELGECDLAFDIQLICDMKLLCNIWLTLQLKKCSTIITKRTDKRRWTNRQIEIHCHSSDAFRVHEPVGVYEGLAPFRILSSDGEMRSHKRGFFPRASLNPIIHMGFSTRESVITAAPPEKPYTSTIVGCVGACKELDRAHNTEVIQCTSELDLLILTVYMLSCSALAYDADMHTGWNFDAFDMPYIEERLRILFGPPACRSSKSHQKAIRFFTAKGVLPTLAVGQNYEDVAHDTLLRFFPHWDTLRAQHPNVSAYTLLMRQMSCFVRGHLKDHNGRLVDACTARLIKRKFKSGAHGTTEWNTIFMPGVSVVDGLRRLRKTNTELRAYGLKPVSKHFLGEVIVEFDYEQIPSTHQQALDNPNDATGNRKLVIYAASDARAPQRIDAKLESTLTLMEMGRICGLSVGDQTMRGETVCSTMLLKMAANKTHMLFPPKPIEAPDGTFPGGFVCTPISGFYTDATIVLDFASLYPSIIVTYNVCYSTLVDTRGMSDVERAAHFRKLNITMADVWITPVDGVFFVKRHIREGLLPMICRQLLQSRKVTKKDMAKLKDKLEQFIREGHVFHNMSEAAFNTAVASLIGRIAILNGRQLAKKLRGNSIYGFLGAVFSPIPNKVISEIITTWGMLLDLQSATIVFDVAESGSYLTPISKLKARSAWLDAYFVEHAAQGLSGQTKITHAEEARVRINLEEEVPTPFQACTGGVCCDYETLQRVQMKRTRRMFAKVLQERKTLTEEMVTQANNPYADAPALTGVARIVAPACGTKKAVQTRRLDQTRKQKLSVGTHKLTNFFKRAETHVVESCTTTTTTSAMATTTPMLLSTDGQTTVPAFSTQKRGQPLSPEERTRFYAWCALYCWSKDDCIHRPISHAEIHAACLDTDAGHEAADAFLQKFRPCNGNGTPREAVQFQRKDLDCLQPYYAWEHTPRLTYGDTDSIFVLIPGVPLHVAHVLGFVLELVLNIYFAPLLTIKQEFEKIYRPFDLRVKKKRYTGAYFNPFAMKMKKVDSKGTEVRRRDNCLMLVVILKKINELLFRERKTEEVLPYVNSVFRDIYAGQYDMSQFIQSQKFSKPLKEYAGKSMPHLNVIRKMLARDPEKAPCVGSRVPYIFVEHLQRSKTGERAEDPHWALRHGMKPDYHYYVQEKFRSPIEGALGRVFTKDQIAKAFTGDFTTRRKIRFRPQNSILANAVVARERCIVCHAEPIADIEDISFSVCGANQCWDGLGDLREAAEVKSSKLHNADAVLRKRCEDCCAPFDTKPERCANVTCDIYFKRTEVHNAATAAATRVSSIDSDMAKRDTYNRIRTHTRHTSARDELLRPETRKRKHLEEALRDNRNNKMKKMRKKKKKHTRKRKRKHVTLTTPDVTNGAVPPLKKQKKQ